MPTGRFRVQAFIQHNARQEVRRVWNLAVAQGSWATASAAARPRPHRRAGFRLGVEGGHGEGGRSVASRAGMFRPSSRQCCASSGAGARRGRCWPLRRALSFPLNPAVYPDTTEHEFFIRDMQMRFAGACRRRWKRQSGSGGGGSPEPGRDFGATGCSRIYRVVARPKSLTASLRLPGHLCIQALRQRRGLSAKRGRVELQ